jgi:hypothetical protein
MIDILKKQLISVKRKVDEFKRDNTQDREVLLKNIHILIAYIPKYEKGWAGNWIQNANLYFDDFDSSNSLINLTYNSFIEDIQDNTNINYFDLRNKITSYYTVFINFRKSIITELLLIKEFNYLSENQMLTDIEVFKFGNAIGTVSDFKRPPEAKGLNTPPHLMIIDDVWFNFSRLLSFKDFEELVYNLIRQFEIKLDFGHSVTVIEKNIIVSNEAHFQDIQNRIIERLDAARVSIRIIMAWFTNETLFDKLLEKHAQGIDIKIAIYDDGVNGKHGIDISKLPHYMIKRGKRGGLMHDKFCVVDNQIVITGSYNWTNNAEFRNDENVTIEKDPEQATRFSEEFRRLTI